MASSISTSANAVMELGSKFAQTALTLATQKSNGRKLLLAIILYTVYKYRRSVLFVRPRPELPGPPGLPLIGNFWEIVTTPTTGFLQSQERNFAKYGRVYTMAIPFVGRTITVKDPEILNHVLKTNFWAYEKGARVRQILRPLVGKGILSSSISLQTFG
jgi:hypothetical protein